ncbi:hypothetical protein TRIATDRAFT_85052 [Trichoderma atroviride IMI 206040]|uniref:Uncharacterized protein n=1 Tax=Hypocrea atroviridis (strain ATCC 20476 / IMI 206040) TaxID=452589 RepID=G9P464_HYPAI|nr:uncharacterized protein TRIATDRAFT_85052 [Trichoderma atroviride IMI 206040]EHK41119.1 hypothetical protein TRIATDRAFT_85052 [Trichoderma atroviride IMI 206040]
MNSHQASTLKKGHKQHIHNRTVVNTANTSGTNLGTPTAVDNRPVSLEGAPGNLRFIPGEDEENALGAVSLLVIVSRMLRSVVEGPNGLAEEDYKAFKEVLDFMGTNKNLDNYHEKFKTAAGPSADPFRFARFSQNFITPSRRLAKKAPFALPSVPRKRNRCLEELFQECRRRIRTRNRRRFQRKFAMKETNPRASTINGARAQTSFGHTSLRGIRAHPNKR